MMQQREESLWCFDCDGEDNSNDNDNDNNNNKLYDCINHDEHLIAKQYLKERRDIVIIYTCTDNVDNMVSYKQ